jgi:tetratricopeptide (TPR) repeat protein
LGLAYGMVGQVENEVHEYRLAARLGEHDWHLFLNLGLAYLERHQFDQATAAFQTAMLLSPERAESQFDFVIFYECQENPKDAGLEIYEARRLASRDSNATNLKGIRAADLEARACREQRVKTFGRISASPRAKSKQPCDPQPVGDSRRCPTSAAALER